MDGIKIDVTGNIAKVTEKPRRITSGTIGLPVEFTFDDQWDGLSKKAVFRTGHFSIVCDLNEGENTVPWEVLVFPNVWLSIGVYGVNEGGTVSIPTIWVNVSVIQPGTVPDGASPAEPTPPVWQRIEDEVNRIGDVVDDVNNKYDATKGQVEKLEDETARTAEKQHKLDGRVTKLEENGIGDIAPLIVTLDESTGKASHTATEIYNHVKNGGVSFLLWGTMVLPVNTVDNVFSYFGVFLSSGESIIFRIDETGAYQYNDQTYLTEAQVRNEVNNAVGDIASALDELHTYAQGLINGGAEA